MFSVVLISVQLVVRNVYSFHSECVIVCRQSFISRRHYIVLNAEFAFGQDFALMVKAKRQGLFSFKAIMTPPSCNILESRLQIKWAHESQLLKLSLMLWSVLSDKLGISTCIESILSSLLFSSVKLLSNWGWVVKRPECVWQWLHVCHISRGNTRQA